MRIRSPSSRASIRIRFSPIDVALAVISPLLALYIRDAYILSPDGAILAASYCLVSLICSLIAFSAFGVAGGIPRYYSVHEVLDLTKVVITGELMTCIVLFTFTRLEGIPRSTPAVHALILGAGLVTARALAHLADKKRDLAERPHPADVERVILIGLSDLSVLYMKFLEARARGNQQVIALLDEEPRWIGRSVNGVRVFGPPGQLEALIEEFAVHGIRTDRVVVGGEADILSDEALTEIRRVCARRDLEFVCVPDVFGLSLARQKNSGQADGVAMPVGDPALALALPRYFRCKRAIARCNRPSIGMAKRRPRGGACRGSADCCARRGSTNCRNC
jgi:FlaA1/EpsC-like NDP-sugar epimerase